MGSSPRMNAPVTSKLEIKAEQVREWPRWMEVLRRDGTPGFNATIAAAMPRIRVLAGPVQHRGIARTG